MHIDQDDPYHLRRFVEAQEDVYASASKELAAGRKTGHWMWFIFPQLRGLGVSQTSLFYGISSRLEAEAYLQHPLLGPRLKESVSLVNHIPDRSIEAILGSVDAMKFRSSMTLFAAVARDSRVSNDSRVFQEALEKYFGGQPDPLTLERLRIPPTGG